MVDLRILWVGKVGREGGALCVSGGWGVLKESLRGERVGVRGVVSRGGGGRRRVGKAWVRLGVRGLGLEFGGG